MAAQSGTKKLAFAQGRQVSPRREHGRKKLPPARPPWKLLVVDDEPEVHGITRLVLSDFRFDGRGLEIQRAFSGAEAREMMAADPEIAVILLDVVMETDYAGLEVVQYVRHVLGNNFVRIILRTGHPGLAPERSVIQRYDINDYRAKTEMTRDRMFSVLHTALAAYKHLTGLAQARRHSAHLATEYRETLAQVLAHLAGPADALQAGLARLQPAAGPPAPEAVRGEWAGLKAAAGRVRQVVKALGRLVEHGAATGPAAEFSANEAAALALQRLRALIDERGAQVNVADLPRMQGHAEQFATLLEELLRNAIECQADGVPTVDVAAQANGKYWKLLVADRGPGIPADRRDSVFRPLTQFGDAAGDARLGVGLSLCRRIVAQHGGRLWTEPRPDGGTLMICTIPAQNGYQTL